MLHARRPWILLTLLSLGLGGAIFGSCNKNESGSGAASGPGEVRLGYFGNLTHAQAVLGVSSGEFAQAVQPAKFSTKVFNAGPSLIEALLAGEIDLGYVGPGPVLTAHGRTKG